MSVYQKALDNLYNSKGDLEAQKALLQELVDARVEWERENENLCVACNVCGYVRYIYNNKNDNIECPNCGVIEPDWSVVK